MEPRAGAFHLSELNASDVEQDEDEGHPGHEVDDVVIVAPSCPRRLTLHCTDLSGRVIPITVNDTDPLVACLVKSC